MLKVATVKELRAEHAILALFAAQLTIGRGPSAGTPSVPGPHCAGLSARGRRASGRVLSGVCDWAFALDSELSDRIEAEGG